MKYKVGDRVKIVKNITAHNLQLNKIYSINNVNYQNYTILSEYDKSPRYVIEGEIESENSIEYLFNKLGYD